MHDAANKKTSDQVPGTNTGAKTTLVTQFERFTTGLEYHINSFFVRTYRFHLNLDFSKIGLKKGGYCRKFCSHLLSPQDRL
jgi:hypothetical protein